MPAGTRLWRVHDTRYDSTAFTPPRPSPYFDMGRFDGNTDDPYPYLYAALDEETALLETLARDLKPNQHGDRQLPRKKVKGRCRCALDTTADLALISLRTEQDLAAIGQDQWLISTEEKQFAFTAHWAHWLRAQAVDAQGLIWPSRRNLNKHSVVLFGDRVPADAVIAASVPSIPLWDRAGANLINQILVPYRITVGLPH